ncbi:MAG: mechanosensitive ion channel family protein, partial [Candidatus Limnocylindrales bacterium]
MPDLQRLIDQLAAQGAWIVVVQILLVIVAALIALRFAHVVINAALNRLFAREAAEGTAQDVPRIEVERRRYTLEGLVYRAVRVMILIIAFLMTLQVLRLDIGPAIAGLGIVGLALSLGAQHLVRDYVAGAFVLIENQYSKGDVINIAGVTGAVEDVSLRRTTLRDFDGTVHYVPHGLIQTASNLTRTWAGINLDLPVPYEQDLARVSAAVDAAAQWLANEPTWVGGILEAPRVVRVEHIAEQGLIVKVFGRVTPQSRFVAAGELRRLIVEESARRGVIIGWRAVSEGETATSSPASRRGAALDERDATTAASADPAHHASD